MVWAVLAQLHDGHVGAGVERVEVFPLLLVHAIERVLFDALHTSFEIPATRAKNGPLLKRSLRIYVLGPARKGEGYLEREYPSPSPNLLIEEMLHGQMLRHTAGIYVLREVWRYI